MLPETDFSRARHRMIEQQLRPNGIQNERLLTIMERVPRHEFMPPGMKHLAYHDIRLPIGDNEYSSQPVVIARMLQILSIGRQDKVLEIGTGTGYQTAILERLSYYIYSLERHPRLAEHAGEILHYHNFHNVDVHIGDGSQGLSDMANFDVIIVNASAPRIPMRLVAQLEPDGGRMLIPIGYGQRPLLHLVTRKGKHFIVNTHEHAPFERLGGRYGFDELGDQSAPT